MTLRTLLLSLGLLTLAGCAAGPELRVVREAGTVLELSDVPFFAQELHQCGPAALATVLLASGVAVSPEQLAPQIYLPERRGSLQVELLAATRRHGRVPFPLPGHIRPLLDEVRAGRPVLVFQNLGLDRLPVWHYAVLIGFDAKRQQFLLRSGTERRVAMDAKKFLASWDRGGRWAMVVAPASEPPGSAEVMGWLKALAPFESLGQLDRAAEGYTAAVARWPLDARTWTALGNARYRQGRLADAEAAYTRALHEAPDQWVARNNLVQTLLDRGCKDAATPWASLEASPPPEMASTWAETRARLAQTPQGSCKAS